MNELLGGPDAAFIAELIDSHIRPEDLTPDDMPSKVGPYHVIEPLGRGRDGQAYLARGPGSERAVALKHFDRDSACSERELQALLRRLQSVEDRAIVPIRAILRVDKRIVVCMDYVTEATLADRDLTLTKGLAYLERVARVCNTAHQAGLVHGDLRPGNFLLGAQPRILDFGLAELFADRRVPFGAPPYLAPEVARGAAPSPASDVYSLGAVLYELLCGVPPFGIDSDKEVLARLKGGEAPRSPRSRAPETPRALERIALQALARDPRGRQESAGAFAEDLATWNTEVGTPVAISGRWAWVALGVGVPLAAALAGALLGGARPLPAETPASSHPAERAGDSEGSSPQGVQVEGRSDAGRREEAEGRDGRARRGPNEGGPNEGTRRGERQAPQGRRPGQGQGQPPRRGPGQGPGSEGPGQGRPRGFPPRHPEGRGPGQPPRRGPDGHPRSGPGGRHPGGRPPGPPPRREGPGGPGARPGDSDQERPRQPPPEEPLR